MNESWCAMNYVTRVNESFSDEGHSHKTHVNESWCAATDVTHMNESFRDDLLKCAFDRTDSCVCHDLCNTYE